jgi:ubiquinone/menaquinone biosynthesis C-methylase UbiE
MTKEESYQKWETVAKKYRIDNSKLATFELTVDNVLKLLKDKNKGLALDVGCGNGLIDIMLVKKTGLQLIGCDISDTMLAMARTNVEKENIDIKFENQDVYNLTYPDNYFNVVFSFGYASAATYPNARKEVYRVLKPGGLLICDFINHNSLYKLLLLPKNIIKGNTTFQELLAIKKEFKLIGFKFLSKTYFNTYPPVFKKFISVKIYILFENTIGRLFRKILGRVILICFQK